MIISIILAWLAVISAALCAFKFIARKSKKKELNKAFHKCHIPFGVLTIIFGLMHGLLAGNFPGSKLSEIQLAPILFSFNWGTACFVVAVLLGISYLFRKKLKKKWIIIHRVLTVVMIVLVVIHIINMGITVFDKISDAFEKNNSVEESTTLMQSITDKDNGSENTTSALSEENTSSNTDTTTIEAQKVTFSGAVLKDGTYQGSASGFEGAIKVSVTVSEGKVSDITILEENDSPNFFQRAVDLVDTIINGQTLEVDAVSGATFSSAGIVNAVNDALEEAVESGTLNVTKFDLSSIKRGH